MVDDEKRSSNPGSVFSNLHPCTSSNGTFGAPEDLGHFWGPCGSISDLNDDEHLDVVSLHGDSMHVFLGDGLGNFVKSWGYNKDQQHYYYMSTEVCDLDLDGDQDLICSYYDHGPRSYGIAVFMGNGDGSFSEAPDIYGSYPANTVIQYIEAGDFNEDSYPDIAGGGYASLDEYAVGVFINQQDGTFLASDSAYYENGGAVQYSLEARDIDLDGHLDLSISGNSEIIPGYGDGYFSDDPDDALFSSGTAQILLRTLFLDLDSDLDILKSGSNYMWVYLNTTIQLGCSEGEGAVSRLVINASPIPFTSILHVSVEGISRTPAMLRVFSITGRLIDELACTSFVSGTAEFTWEAANRPPGVCILDYSDGISTVSARVLNL